MPISFYILHLTIVQNFFVRDKEELSRKFFNFQFDGYTWFLNAHNDNVQNVYFNWQA